MRFWCRKYPQTCSTPSKPSRTRNPKRITNNRLNKSLTRTFLNCIRLPTDFLKQNQHLILTSLYRSAVCWPRLMSSRYHRWKTLLKHTLRYRQSLNRCLPNEPRFSTTSARHTTLNGSPSLSLLAASGTSRKTSSLQRNSPLIIFVANGEQIVRIFQRLPFVCTKLINQ